jgi:putative N6-adenine-specific DNA methylase
VKYFFVSCPIHFEKELIKEIENFWYLLMDLDGLPTRHALPEFEIDKGGLSFQCPIHLGLQINFFSHIANRVLLRHTDFKARYFDQFEKEFKKIDFTKIFNLSKNKKISIEIESSKSRLFHEKNLTESLQKILSHQNIVVSKESESRVFIRLFNDIVTVSIDTTGPHLHFRGYRQNQGSAPIRENLAYLTLQIAGLMSAKQHTILDPFCGSGTMLFESNLLGYPNLNRAFPFFDFPMTPSLFKSPSWKKNFRWLIPHQNKLIGIEKDLSTYEKALLNTNIFTEVYFKPDITLYNENSLIFDLTKLGSAQTENLWIVTNPPYGERLDTDQVPTILQRFESIDSLQGVVVLHPADWRFKFKKLNLSLSIPFTNQGLKLSLSVFKRRQLFI